MGEKIVDKNLLVRRVSMTANRVVAESEAGGGEQYEQLDLFTDYAEQRKRRAEEEAALERERRVQEAVLDIKKKYGKNAILKGMNLMADATAKERNAQIGGHKA